MNSLEIGGGGDHCEPLETLLTPKEKVVLQYLSRGYSNKEIAKSLVISPHTVASHIKHIYRKLEVNSRNEAVFEGYKMGQICIHQHTQPTSTDKSPVEIAQALLIGKKTVTDVTEILKLVFDFDLKHCIETLKLAGCGTCNIFIAIKSVFKVKDVVIMKAMIDQGLNHEEVLQAVITSPA
ncbi:response regulator transcription factor [Leucothrix pacifica]|uniref:response regulator transcription factor n=1 Tax=Leucothrix pacifica TaxID=1247513 RepID=UPI0015E86D72|nr:helix-turn-helix transcriptional regulator [Leucothrix pacifica]